MTLSYIAPVKSMLVENFKAGFSKLTGIRFDFTRVSPFIRRSTHRYSLFYLLVDTFDRTMSAIELPKPKSPSGLVKVGRYSLLAWGILYGMGQRERYFKKETARREQEEAERPAKEAALQAEKDKRIAEEMEYLGRETGVLPRNPTSAKGLAKTADDHKADCGCKY